MVLNYTPIKTNGNTAVNSSVTGELERLQSILAQAELPTELRNKAENQLLRARMAFQYGGNLSHIDIVSRYFDWIVNIPWQKKYRRSTRCC